ncbi:MAG: terminase small subunit, partial [Acidimicrobiia bacterium]
MAAEICRRIGEGEPLVKICRDSAIPAYRTVLGWRVTN